MGAYDDLVGELQPGDLGWLPLDEAGIPNGPATISPPPGPNAKAANVMSPIYKEGETGDLLVSSSGAPLVPPLNSNVDRRYGDTAPPPPEPPVLNSISPSSADFGTPAISVTFAGSGFTPNSVAVIDGVDAATTFVSGNSVTAQIDPSVELAVRDISVLVSEGEVDTLPQIFSFTQAPARSGTSRRR